MAALELNSTTLINDANLVSYWRMEGNSNDSKGSNNGTDTSVTYNTSNGKFGQGGGYAAASSSKTVITDAASLKQTGNFTIGAWVKTSTTGTVRSIFASYSANTNTAGVLLLLDSTNKARAFSAKNTGTTVDVDYKNAIGTTTITDGNWHWVVMTWNGSNLIIYVDGTAEASPAWANAPAYAATNYVRIGCYNETGTDVQFWDGAIDDVFIMSRALSATEITNHWNGTDALPSTTDSSYSFFM